MKRLFGKSRSIRTRMFVHTSAVMVLVIFCMVFIMRLLMIARLKTDQIELHLLETQSQLDTLDNYLMTLMVKTDALFANQDFSDMITAHPADVAEKTTIANGLRKAMDLAIYSLRYPEVSIANYPGGQVYATLYTENEEGYMDGEFILSFSDIRGEPFVEDLMTQRRMFSWSYGATPQIGSYIAFNRRLLEYRGLTDVAVLQIRVPTSKIQQILNVEKADSVLALFYLDTDNRVLYAGGSRALLDDLTMEDDSCHIVDLPRLGGQCLASSARSQLNGCRLVCVSSAGGIQDSVDFVTPIFIAGGLATVALCTLLLFFLSGSLLKGLTRLTEKTRRASEGPDSYENLGPIHDTSEIEALDAAYGRMVHTINALHADESRYQEAINEVQIELLQEQFNPHLLYNTLSLARHLSAQDAPDAQSRTGAVLDNLISFYRRVLNRGQIVIRVRDEIQMIQSYLNIIRDVYEVDLDVRMSVDEEAMDCRVVKLFLQPIVENAIQHGLLEVGAGTLSLSGTRTGDRLVFVVEDDGMGIEADKLAQIRLSIARSEDMDTENYGLVSISRRLRLFFGSDYSMSIDSEPGEGTRVEIRIPAFSEDQINASLRSRMI